MGRHWSGFMAQNELAKLHWAVLEQCQMSGPEKDFTMFSLAGLQEQHKTADAEERPDLDFLRTIRIKAK